MQKSRKTESRISSTSTLPVIRPIARVARRRSSAKSSGAVASPALCAWRSDASASFRAWRWRGRVRAGLCSFVSSLFSTSAVSASQQLAGLRRFSATGKVHRALGKTPDRFYSRPPDRALIPPRISGGIFAAGPLPSSSNTVRWLAAASARARRTPSASMASPLSRRPAVSATCTG